MPLLDYGDVIYDQPENESFSSKTDSVQYNVSLVITGAVKGTSQEELHQELGLESLRSRRWLRLICYFYILKNSKAVISFQSDTLGHPNTYLRLYLKILLYLT